MTQYNFGTIDPYVVDGVQLAGMLNQWRDAMHSYHRGATRPVYIVPGMLWIDDSGGASAWKLKVYLSAGLGDRELFVYNTTTGAITISAASGGAFAALNLLAQGTVPTIGVWDTDNPIDQKRWEWNMTGTGVLRLQSLSDAGAVQSTISFNRDGTLAYPIVRPSFRLRITANDVLSGPGSLAMFRSTAAPVEDFDTGNAVVITASNATFTAPSAGKYLFGQALNTSAAAAATVSAVVRHMTAASALIRDYYTVGTVFGGNQDGNHNTALIDMAVGEKVEFFWTVSNAVSVTLNAGTATALGSFAHGFKVSD